MSDTALLAILCALYLAYGLFLLFFPGRARAGSPLDPFIPGFRGPGRAFYKTSLGFASLGTALFLLLYLLRPIGLVFFFPLLIVLLMLVAMYAPRDAS